MSTDYDPHKNLGNEEHSHAIAETIELIEVKVVKENKENGEEEEDDIEDTTQYNVIYFAHERHVEPQVEILNGSEDSDVKIGNCVSPTGLEFGPAAHCSFVNPELEASYVNNRHSNATKPGANSVNFFNHEDRSSPSDNSDTRIYKNCGECLSANKTKLKNKIEHAVKVNKIVEDALPILRKSVFLSILTGVFVFYVGVVCLAILLLLVSIWFT